MLALTLEYDPLAASDSLFLQPVCTPCLLSFLLCPPLSSRLEKCNPFWPQVKVINRRVCECVGKTFIFCQTLAEALGWAKL